MARAGSGALLVGTYREVAADCRTQIVFDNDGRLHFAALEPEPEPASLLDLLAAVNAMLPPRGPVRGAAGGVLRTGRPGIHVDQQRHAGVVDAERRAGTCSRWWEPEELISVWTLLEEDMKRLRNQSEVNRLGFALLLKLFEAEAGFPEP
ncbi:hypothetical protein OG313_03455 [Streptomyces virginiae]|nr:hypothetical protein [Streptomyces virginiae]MCX5174591.1 hypothetical protein [Streptomyces virginiae]